MYGTSCWFWHNCGAGFAWILCWILFPLFILNCNFFNEDRNCHTSCCDQINTGQITVLMKETNCFPFMLSWFFWFVCLCQLVLGSISVSDWFHYVHVLYLLVQNQRSESHSPDFMLWRSHVMFSFLIYALLEKKQNQPLPWASTPQSLMHIPLIFFPYLYLNVPSKNDSHEAPLIIFPANFIVPPLILIPDKNCTWSIFS